MVRVLFLEDEPVILEVLSEYMKLQGYDVRQVADGREAVHILEQETFQMAVLDINVPGKSGLEVLSYIREKELQTSVIMLTAIDEEQTQLHAFNLFADDYVIKPVSPLILLKRMAAILRRSGLQDGTVSMGHPSAGGGQEGLFVRTEAYQAFYHGQSLGLTVSEFLLLNTLYQEPKRVFTREQLILRIFNEDYIGNDRIIDAHVKNLRKKLPISCIKTIIGAGYQYKEEE